MGGRATRIGVGVVWTALSAGGTGCVPLPGTGTGDTGGTGLATAYAPGCADIDGVHYVDRPLYPDDPASGAFPYAVRVEDGDDDTLPTVVFVPGGPGQGSIEAGRAYLPVPAGFTVVYTDPRGVGCNALVDAETGAAVAVDDPAAFDADAFYGTERFADDILAALDALDLTEVIVYGHSYGTVLATVTASKAEDAGALDVKAVALEGTLGGVLRKDAGFDTYAEQWDFVMSQLPATAAAMADDPLPLGLDADAWGTWAAARLPLGGVDSAYGPINYVTLALLPLEYGGDAAALEGDVRAASAPSDDPAMRTLYEHVGCTELAERSYFAATLVDGALAPVDDWCADLEVTAPYDPADWPLQAPITYVQGTADPATPYDQVQPHLDGHPDADRHFVEVAGGGHQPWILNLADCADAMWDGIARGEAPKVGGCAWPVTLTTTPGNG